MTFLLPDVPLPLAAGFDAFGIIVFLIVAAVSAFAKKAEASGNKKSSSPRPPTPQQSQPDLEEEMRRFLSEVQQRGQMQPMSVRPKPPALARSVRPATTPKKPSPPPVEVLSRPSLVPAPEKTVPVKPMNIQAEIAQSMSDARDDITAERTSILSERSDVQAGPAMRWSLETFRTPSQLKQAIVLREVLGPPRALEPL